MGKMKFQSRVGGHYSPTPPKPKAKAKIKKEVKVSNEAKGLEAIKAKKETKEGGDK